MTFQDTTIQNLNKNEHMYTKNLKNEVKEILKVYNLFNGYANASEEGSDSTGFF